MKKTLIAIFALTGIVMGETSTYEVDNSMTLPSSGVAGDFLVTKGESDWATLNWTGSGSNVTATNMQTNIASNAKLAEDGWHYCFANGTANNSEYTDLYVGTKDGHNWLGVGTRNVSGGGTILTLTQSVSGIIKNNTDVVTSLTFTISSAADASEYFGPNNNIGGTSNDVYYALFAIDAQNNVSDIIPMQGNGGTAITKGQTTTITANNLTLGGTDKIMLAMRNGAGGWAQEFVISEFTNKAVVLAQSNPVIPEPATATLSLLALAGLAARRRR